jgi:hypothetical protein
VKEGPANDAESAAKDAESAAKEDKAATAPAGDEAAAAAAASKEKAEGDKSELEEGEVPPTPPTAKQVRVRTCQLLLSENYVITAGCVAFGGRSCLLPCCPDAFCLPEHKAACCCCTTGPGCTGQHRLLCWSRSWGWLKALSAVQHRAATPLL